MNNFYNTVLFFIFVNVAIANQDIGCFLTTTLANNDDYRLSLYIKNRLEKGRFPEIIDNYLKQKGYTEDYIFLFFHKFVYLQTSNFSFVINKAKRVLDE